MALQRRIALHIVAFAALLLATLAFGAWWVVTEAEDEVLDRYLLQTVPLLQRGPSRAPWLEEFASQGAMRERLALAEIPQAPGWYTIFASSDGRHARWVRGWKDRTYIWRHGLEDEYRVHVGLLDDRTVWTLVHLDDLEYTEDEIPRLQLLVLLFGGLAWLVSVMLSARLARSAMAPVVDLTRRLHRHEASAEPLAAACAEDEVGMLARALDDALAREREGMLRERRFVSDCSHELRTPLAIFRGALGLLAAADVDETRRAELLARLERSVGRLEGLSHTFLVMAREDRVRGTRSSQTIAALVREACAEQRLLFPHRVLHVQISVSDDATVEGQRDVLIVLFRNVLNNVFQH
jgi:signal transduction histidine kinase